MTLRQKRVKALVKARKVLAAKRKNGSGTLSEIIRAKVRALVDEEIKRAIGELVA